MLESLAAWILNNYLGKYVENLNTDQLSIGLLQGQVELENLPLKKEALRQAGLPIQIKAGFIGKIKLQIPFRQIRTAPWVIHIEKLYLVAGPVNLLEWDEEAEAQALHEQKLNALDTLEVQWRANMENQDQGYYASSYSSWLNFGTSIITNIVENFQSLLSLVFWLLIGERLHLEVDFFKLNIIDVHFRYEDDICIPDQCFTFGLAIDSLVAQSCNQNWEPGFDSGQFGFKIVELSRFSIYWDDCSLSEMIGNKEGQEFMECMGKTTYRGRHFVLNHVSGVAHIKRSRSTEPLRSRTTPRIICDIIFEEFPIIICDKQYAQMILWLKGVAVINTRIKNHRFRPQCSVFECPKAWWHYACQGVLNKIRPHRYSWDILLKRIKDNVKYVEIYRKVLSSPNRTASLSPEEQATKNTVEYEQSFEELRILREIALHKACPPAPPQSPPKVVAGSRKNFLSTWFPQWWYSSSPNLMDSPSHERTSLDDEIIDAFAKSSDTTYLRRDVVFGLFNFTLSHGSVQLCAAVFEHKKLHFKSVMELQFEKVLVGFEYRPRSGSYKTTLALGSIYLKDRLTKETVFPMLISPQVREGVQSVCTVETKRFLSQNFSRLLSHAMQAPGAPKPSDETLFQLSYEFKPFNSNADYRILMKTQSLDVVYNPEAVNWLTDFFTKPLHQSSDTNLRAAARQKYQAIKTATKNELIKNWEKILAGDLEAPKWSIKADIEIQCVREVSPV